MSDIKKKKRASLSSFSIILSILVGLALVTVIMALAGVEGVQGATLSDVLTAPVKGFQGAMGVCIFVMILVSSNPLRYQQSAESGTASQRAWYPG